MKVVGREGASTSELVRHYAQLCRERSAKPEIASNAGLDALLQALARWRSRTLANTVVAREGTVVQSGPFAGMDYVQNAAEGCLLPRLLGSYESELHPTVEGFAAAGLDAIIDIGCAEGYYAVGMARLAPATTVYAHDIDPVAQAACAALAAKNGVADRVEVGGIFNGEDFAAFEGRKVLVLMDAEGAEDDLLKPADWPALAHMNLIVETHNMYRPGVTARLIERFSPTHAIEVIDHAPRIMARPDWLKRLGHLDQLIAVWEWRSGPTPWLVMRPKAKRA
jgi:hypothetical protein